MKYRETGNRSDLLTRLSSPWADPLAYSVEGYSTLFDVAAAAVERADRGETSDSEAARAIYEALRQFKAMPSFITRREEEVRTIGTFTVPRLMRMYAWGRTRGPVETKRYYDFTVRSFVGEITSTFLPYLMRQTRLPLQPLWDMVFSASSNAAPRDLVRPAEGALRRLKPLSPAPQMEMQLVSRETNGRSVQMHEPAAAAPTM